MGDNGFDTRLSGDGWGKLYNLQLIDQLIDRISNKKWSVWTEELLNLTKPGDYTLEIGCGSGETSLVLAREGRFATALDYSAESLNLVNEAANRLEIDLTMIMADATLPLPLKEEKKYIVFQSGLLEHYTDDEQIKLLKNWKPFCKRMISLIPNANSLAYMVGKSLMEREKTWKWGLEIPRKSIKEQFVMAGFSDIEEYTIGSEHALAFLPENHFLRKSVKQLMEEGYDLDEMGQGYLLVTIGNHC